MDENPLMPLGNSFRNNILIGCQKPFSIAKDIQEEWLDRENNPKWSMDEYPFLAEKGASEAFDLEKLRPVWQKVSGFQPIPIEKIGINGRP